MARSFEVVFLDVLRWGARVESGRARRVLRRGRTTGGAPACVLTTALAPSSLAALSIRNTNVIPKLKVSPRDLLCFVGEGVRGKGESIYKRLSRAGPFKLSRGLLLEDGRDARPDKLGRLAGVDGLPDARLSVVIDDGSGLLRLGQKGRRKVRTQRQTGRHGSSEEWMLPGGRS